MPAIESCKAFCILVESSELQTQEYHNYNSHFTWQPQWQMFQKEMRCLRGVHKNDRVLCASLALKSFLLYQDYFLNLQHIPHLEPSTLMSWPLSSIAAIWQICKSGIAELSSKTLCTEHSLNRWVAWNPYLPPSEGNYFEVFWNCCKQEDIFYLYICVYIYIYIFFI